MWPTRAARLADIESGLKAFSRKTVELKGIKSSQTLHSLAMQMIASLRRLEYTAALMHRDINSDRCDPSSSMFDPERAAILKARQGDTDEAIWLVFLSIHFGKHGKHGWRMLRDVYSGLGSGLWTWARVSADPSSFRKWLNANRTNIGGAFGNHRKYETLDTESEKGTATVIESFVALCVPSPSQFIKQITRSVGNDPGKIFDAIYKGAAIFRFGRLAKFDFLCLLGRMDLAPIAPAKPYLKGSTGPLRGARLLVDGDFGSSTTADDLDAIVQQLDKILNVGMQVMEDAICNWQKSPSKFVHFRG